MSGPSIRTLMLADHAEAINGKLYIHGGGFTAMAVRDFGTVQRCALAAILDIPPDHPARPIPIAAHVEDDAGNRVGSWELTGAVAAAEAPEGVPGTAVLAGPVELELDGPADLRIRFSFGDARATIPLRVVAG
ncbi:MAG TPA: hypothetical protein VFZ00_05525 [Solirubrobacter sp.]|nr:hypothetical protein [Solirubrobacter sp.]